WYDRQIRQQRLDRALIAAIKHNRIPTAIALLDAGADANTVDKPRKPITWKSLLADFGSRFHGYVPPKETEYYPPALLLPYRVPDEPFDAIAPTSDAIARTSKDEEARLVQALLQHGADPDVQDEQGKTLL